MMFQMMMKTMKNMNTKKKKMKNWKLMMKNQMMKTTQKSWHRLQECLKTKVKLLKWKQLKKKKKKTNHHKKKNRATVAQQEQGHKLSQ